MHKQLAFLSYLTLQTVRILPTHLSITPVSIPVSVFVPMPIDGILFIPLPYLSCFDPDMF